MSISVSSSESIADNSFRSAVDTMTMTPEDALRTKQSSLAAVNTLATVQELSNLGCKSVSIQEYPEANRLFELALTKHLVITQSSSSPESSYNDCDGITHVIDSYTDSGIENGDNNNEISLDIDFDFEDERDDRFEGIEDIEDYCDIDCDSFESSILIDESVRSKDLAVSFNNTFAPETTSMDIRPAFVGISLSSTMGACGPKHPQQMTASSTLPICSFNGQRHDSRKYHEVYCSTIAMNGLEWKSAQAESKTFVLLFNAALCNHLWALDLQQHEQQNETQESEEDNQSRGAFLVADQLYRLALDHATTVGNIPFDHCHTSTTNNGIDFRLCVVALLNNLSHTTKTLEGTTSPQAHHVDLLLLNAIFWWRDSRSTSVVASTDPNISDYTYHHSHNDRGDANAEIVDLCLEHVFYLIGTQESFTCAPTA